MDGGKMSQIQGQCRRSLCACRALRRGRAALLPAAHLPVRLRRQLLQRAAHQHHQRRSCQRPRQPRLPHDRHGREVFRRHAARRARRGRVRRRAHRGWPPPCAASYEAEMEKFQFQNASGGDLQGHSAARTSISTRPRPWVLAKDEANRARLATRDVQPPRDHPHLHHPAHAVHSRLLREDLRADRRGGGLPRLGTAPPNGAA